MKDTELRQELTDMEREMLDAFLNIEGRGQVMHEAARQKLYERARADMAQSIGRMRRAIPAGAELEPVPVVRAARSVPDPSMSDAEFIHQKRQEQERAERRGRAPKLDVGMIPVTENAITRIGALVYIRRRENHHERAAEQFKSLYEARYGCGTPAMDASREPVDRSTIAHDAGMAAKIDRTWRLRQAEVRLGKPAFDRLVALLVLCIPISDGIERLPSGQMNKRQMTKGVDEILADLDHLAEVWEMQSKAA